MKKITLSCVLSLFTYLSILNTALAQVGINTTDPKGVLDFNSSTLGVVYPNVALTATNSSSPLVNPQGGAILAGTVVYNTNTTNTGLITDVYPGIYAWDGSEWIVHYKKRQSELYNQTSLLRPEANFATDWEDIPGLGIGDTKTFTAKYSGLYRIEVKTNFGGGRTETNNSIFTSQASGQFRFLFDGTPYTFETSAFSAFSSYIGSGTYSEGIWKESYKTTYVSLIAGTTYPFSLCFDAYDAPGFIGNGSTTTGGGGPTLFDLINENFEAPYTVVQIHTSDPQCSTDGWETSTSNSCAACTGEHLYIHSDSNNCSQNATATISFIPSVTTIDITFDYLYNERRNANDSFRVYLYDESNSLQVGANLVDINNNVNNTFDTSYTGSIPVVPGISYTLRFEYISDKARYASVDNVIISELSGPPTPPSGAGRGYVGNEINCQIEITYIGE
jgi:hypothetical protein